MPSHVPAELELTSPLYEEDIGDLSPYVALPLSASSRTSSTTLTTSESYSTRSTLVRNEFDSDHVFGANEAHRMDSLRRAFLSTNSRSPSLSSLPIPSLPAQTPAQKLPRKFQSEFDALIVDSDAVAKMRRWILGIAVGVYFPTAGFHVVYLYPQVEFDIDTGPTIDGSFPPLNFEPSESETLCVHAFANRLHPLTPFQSILCIA